MTASEQSVRVRFAPSPTGPLHIGGVRTALFNWLFARHSGGAFILRIEDTDRNRYVPESVQGIIEGLRWLGLDWDEGPEVGGEFGPYVQSERLDLYRKWADWLVEHDKAYRCYCTPQRLNALREQQRANKQSFGYDRHCRYLTPEERQRLHEETGGQYVIRFKMPLEGQTVVHDLLRGEITFENEQLNDLVLLKTDGYPTYHLANVVDDHLMQISHIMRAEEWISTAPIHKNLYDAFGWEMPQLVHLPIILNPSGKGKLSKRKAGFTQAGMRVPVLLDELREAGYLPEALVNFLINVGWSFGDDREVFSVQEAIERFDITRINPAASVFPVDKLTWLNGVYIRQMDDARLAELVKPILERAGYTVDDDKLMRVIPLIKERMKTLNDVVAVGGFFFEWHFSPAPPDLLIPKGMSARSTQNMLEAAARLLERLPDFEPETQEQAMRKLAEKLKVKPGQLFSALRVATTARKATPPLFETMAILGRETCLKRIHRSVRELDTVR